MIWVAWRMAEPLPILLYHSVSLAASPRYRPYCIDPEQLDAHMQYLRVEGYEPITVSALRDAVASDAQLPARPVVLSFDDALLDFYDGALPVLTRYGFPATLYVVAGMVGGVARWLRKEGEGGRPLMSWAQLRESRALGIECGAHGSRHLAIDVLPVREATAEIVAPKAEIEDRLGCAVRTYAYPYGYHTGALEAVVREAGYRSACAVRHAMSHADDDPFALARIVVTNDVSVDVLARWLSGRGLAAAKPGERLRTRAWRQVRRWTAERQIEPDENEANEATDGDAEGVDRDGPAR
jgi:peptidoglycan/xylan/chitin deacetylase (PgdA/CDA1 family)